MSFSHEVGIVVFRIVISTLLLSIQLLLYLRAKKWLSQTLPDKHWVHRMVAGLFMVMNLAFLYVAIVRPRPNELSPLFMYLAAYSFFLWHATTLFIGIVVVLGLLIRLPFALTSWMLKMIRPVQEHLHRLKATTRFQEFDNGRRTFLRRSMYGLTAVSLGGSAYGMFVGKKEHEITEAIFPLRNLYPSLHGFTIALISDIHSSFNMMKEDMEEYVQIVNALGCDMILVTGDFVNSTTEEVYPFAEAFSNLKAPFGIYGVMGNHDFFAPEPEVVAREVDACGVRLLRNDKTLITKNGGSFYLLGVDDVGNPRRAEEKFSVALSNATLEVPKVLMVHRPYFLQQAAEKGFDLVLSGHTHGGQIVLANFGKIVIAPASLASRYVWGKYSIGNTQMYVNRGIGTVGLPIRLNCPPEITRITLVPQSIPVP